MGEFHKMPIISEDVKVDKETSILQIGKQHFRLQYTEHGHPYLVQVDPKKFKKMVDKIFKVSVTALDKERLLRYCLNRMPVEDLQKIEKKLKKPRRPVMKTTEGCMEMSIGGISIPIAD